MLRFLCRIGIHKWSSFKQWRDSKGDTILARRCLVCGKVDKFKENSDMQEGL